MNGRNHNDKYGSYTIGTSQLHFGKIMQKMSVVYYQYPRAKFPITWIPIRMTGF